MQIVKVKILKDEAPELTYHLDKGSDDVARSETHTEMPHADFENSLLGMRIHLAVLTGYVTTKQVKKIDSYDSALVEDFMVTGYSTKVKAGEPDGITITGYKLTPYGTVILNAPYLKFQSEEDSQYAFISHLMERLEVCDKEATDYVTGAKRAPKPQLQLDLPEGKAETIEEAEEIHE